MSEIAPLWRWLFSSIERYDRTYSTLVGSGPTVARRSAPSLRVQPPDQVVQEDEAKRRAALLQCVRKPKPKVLLLAKSPGPTVDLLPRVPVRVKNHEERIAPFRTAPSLRRASGPAASSRRAASLRRASSTAASSSVASRIAGSTGVCFVRGRGRTATDHQD